VNRLDWVVVKRLLGSIGLTLLIIAAVVVLIEATNTRRFTQLAEIGGLPLAIASIAGSSARWVIDTLPLTLLVGAVAGLLNLQSTREMTVIKASGVSIWRLMMAPLAVTILGGLAVALLLDTAVVTINRTIAPIAGNNSGGPERLWLDERETDAPYMLEAGYGDASGNSLSDVVIFMLEQPRDRIEAPRADLVAGEWVMQNATRFRSNSRSVALADYRLPTTYSPADIEARLTSVDDMTVFELMGSLGSQLNDQRERAELGTRFLRLVGLPLTLCGSLVIAFAFTAGYRRTNKYGGAVLYGIVLGSLVYVVTEMAGRAGSAGLINPALAVVGPALVAIVMGVTVLLNREDGRT